MPSCLVLNAARGRLLAVLLLVHLPVIVVAAPGDINVVDDGFDAFNETENEPRDEYKSYDGYQVLTMSPQSQRDLMVIKNLESTLGFELDFFRHGAQIGSRTDVIIPPDLLFRSKNYLLQNNVDYNVTVPNLRIPIERQRRALGSRPVFSRVTANTFNVNTYHTHAEQMQFLSLVAGANPSITRLFIIGKSSQNRDLLGVTLGAKTGRVKPVLFIDGGIHAREWISPAVALWLIKEFLKPQYRSLLNVIDIMIVPNMNPDGYEWSRTRDRLWRKTRSGPTSGCFGADPNRNFPFRYAFQGSSPNPCSDIYHGRGALSEPECRALRNVLLARRNNIKAYVTLHSYGENILYPWGYRVRTYPSDVNDLIIMGRAMSAAIQRVHGTRYQVANAADSLYAAAGASDDYAKSVGIKYVYTIELRPGDFDRDNDVSFGFELPAGFIQRTADEVLPGILVLARRVAAPVQG